MKPRYFMKRYVCPEDIVWHDIVDRTTGKTISFNDDREAQIEECMIYNGRKS